MRKFYLLVMAALMTSTMSAEVTTVKAANRNFNFDSAELQPIENLCKNLGKTQISVKPAAGVLSSRPAKAIAKAAAPTRDELCSKDFEMSYSGMLSSNTGTHTGVANFVYDADYDELDLTVPDMNVLGQINSLYVTYEDGKLTFPGQLNYGQIGTGIYLFQIAMGDDGLENIEVSFNEETGSFDFPESATIAFAQVNGSTGSINGYYWAGSNFTLVKPEGDYNLDVALIDECTPDNKFAFTLSCGADVASVKGLLMGYDEVASDYVSVFGQYGTDLQPGTYTVDPTQYTATGAMTESGHASMLFAAYDAKGNVKRTAQFSMIVTLEDDADWRDVGEITYEDQMFSQYYNNFSHTQTATLQEKIDAPGYYRIVNPYSETARHHSAECVHSFLINTQDPEWVEIPFSVSGLDLGGDGILTFGTCAALGFTKETGTAQGLTSGTLVDRTITFPAGSIFCHEQYYNAPGSWSRINSKSAVTMTLPEITLDVVVALSDGTPLEGVAVKLADSVAEVAAYAETEEEATEGFVTTDAEGKATISVPFETGYFGKVNLKIGEDEPTEVELAGANTSYAYEATQATTGIGSISVDNFAAPVRYYNLQGMEIAAPAEGQVVIRVADGKSSKMIVK